MNRIRDERRRSTYPEEYPMGWYALCASHELGRKPQQIDAIGESFAAYRTSAGAPVVLDAYCPHLGANLAHGKVVGDCIECPFHRWQFGPNGRAEAIPYAAKVPPKFGTRAWPVDERYGMIFVYYAGDSNLRTATPPPYSLPDLDPSLRMLGRHDAGHIAMNLIEFAENSADTQHFAPLHGQVCFPWTQIPIPGFRLVHEAGWQSDSREGHVAWFHNDAFLTFRGRRIPGSGASAKIQFIGPGSIVHFTFDVRNRGRIVLVQAHTPLEPLRQRVLFSWAAEPRVSRLLAFYVVGHWISQLRADVAIWENKIYRRKPMLVPEDGPVHALRRWYAQFIPKAQRRRTAPDPRTMLKLDSPAS